ncbi:hypothetical protein, partial [Bradyrhizobium sp. P5_C12]
IAPTGIGKILEKVKCGAADQRKPLVQNGINCIRPQARWLVGRNGLKCQELDLSKSCPPCLNKRTSTRRRVTSLIGQKRS